MEKDVVLLKAISDLQIAVEKLNLSTQQVVSQGKGWSEDERFTGKPDEKYLAMYNFSAGTDTVWNFSPKLRIHLIQIIGAGGIAPTAGEGCTVELGSIPENNSPMPNPVGAGTVLPDDTANLVFGGIDKVDFSSLGGVLVGKLSCSGFPAMVGSGNIVFVWSQG